MPQRSAHVFVHRILLHVNGYLFELVNMAFYITLQFKTHMSSRGAMQVHHRQSRNDWMRGTFPEEFRQFVPIHQRAPEHQVPIHVHHTEFAAKVFTQQIIVHAIQTHDSA